MSRRGLLAGLALLIFIGSMLYNSSDQEEESKAVEPGQYYWFECSRGGYKVLKVLVVEEYGVHVCYYNNIFEEPPTEDAIESLYFGKKGKIFSALFSREGNRAATGSKHLPLIWENWEYWKPSFLADGEVEPDELEAYEEWQEGDRYVSGVLMIPTD
jgi:hypothetical protein